jgi:diadenosine tetraphosphate (Ap4A) HIT family hydrolase
MADECAFCKIIRGEAEGSWVHADEWVVAFMDIQPITQGHMLVVPREHYVLMKDVPEQTLLRSFHVARNLAATSEHVLAAGGVNLFVADGEVAFQDVPHFHVHVIPRYAKDGFGLTFPESYESPPPRGQLHAIAAALHAAEPQG